MLWEVITAKWEFLQAVSKQKVAKVETPKKEREIIPSRGPLPYVMKKYVLWNSFINPGFLSLFKSRNQEQLARDNSSFLEYI